MAQIDERQTQVQDQQLPNMEMPVAVRVRKVRKRIRHAVTPLRVLFTTAVVALCMTLLYNQMHLTRLTKEIGEQTTTLENLQSEYVSLKTQQEQALSISYVEEYAQSTLGMVKMDPSQVEYIEMTNPEVTEVSNTGATLGDAVANLMRSFTAVLEYLR
ncbi:MAG: cell division protein FtsL [Butyricicoccus sp.]